MGKHLRPGENRMSPPPDIESRCDRGLDIQWCGAPDSAGIEKQFLLRHRCETAAVERARTMSAQRRQMLGRTIALVTFPPVMRMLARRLSHQPVSPGLGEDRGSGDCGFDGIAANDRSRRPAP